jgi:multidrug efflux pump subunit AcrA (membrane-fusion protein)
VAREAVFAVDGEVPGATAGAGVRLVVERARSPQGSVVVPVSALWTDGDGGVRVEVVAAGGRREVRVEVALTVQGRAAVRPVDGALAPGDRVVVAFRDRPAR